MVFRIMSMAITALIISACSLIGSPRIEVSDAAVQEARVSGYSAAELNFRCICDNTTADTTSQAYMTIHNRGEVDTLLKVETEKAVRVELRQSVGDPDLTNAAPVASIVIPARGETEFRPGKYNMVLTGLKEDLKVEEKVKLTLFFEKYGTLDVEIIVAPRN